MTSRRAPKRLQDALSACNDLVMFTSGRSLEDYSTEKGLRLIVERLFEILGEALNHAANDDPSLEHEIPDLRGIVGMRNQLIHGYWDIRDDVVWDTILQDIPQLRSRLATIIEERGWS